MVGERTGGREDHRAGAGRAGRPLRLEEEARESAREGSLEDQAKRSLAVAENEQRGDEDDEVDVKTADRRGPGRDLVTRGTVGGAERQPPRRRAHDEERDRETRLLAVQLTGPTEIVEDEGQTGEPTRRRVHRDLGAYAEEVRDREDHHVDGDERDDVEVRALYGWERAPFTHEARIMRLEGGRNVSMPTFPVTRGAAMGRSGQRYRREPQ